MNQCVGNDALGIFWSGWINLGSPFRGQTRVAMVLIIGLTDV